MHVTAYHHPWHTKQMEYLLLLLPLTCYSVRDDGIILKEKSDGGQQTDGPMKVSVIIEYVYYTE